MKDFFQKFDSNEAILLMYLADELRASDRAEVGEMLKADANLRAQLESLRAAQETVMDGLAELDRSAHLALPAANAQRRAVRLMNQWVQERRKPKPSEDRVIRAFPWMRGSLAAAAMLMIGFFLWVVYHPVAIPNVPPVAVIATDDVAERVELLKDTLNVSDADENDLRVAVMTPRADDFSESLDLGR
jgi:anti-sigma factor RsiW